MVKPRSAALATAIVALSGCVAASPVGPSTGPGPGVAPSASASPAPPALPSASPAAPVASPSPAATPAPGNATPAPGASPAPAATASPAAPSATPTCGPVYEVRTSGKTVILSGYVHDEDGVSLSDAGVMARSLDASVPYTAVTRTLEGNWVVNNLPESANLELLAGKPGYTLRRRVGSFNEDPRVKLAVDFGRPVVMRSPGLCRPPSADGDLLNALSRFPEVAKVARGTDPATADRVVVLTFSHRFDATQRTRLAGALRFFATAATPLDGPDTAIGVPDAEVRDPVIRVGATGAGADKAPGTKDHAPLTWVVAPAEAASGAKLAWSDAGDVLTVTLAAAPPALAEIGFVAPAEGGPILAQGPEAPTVRDPHPEATPAAPDGLARPFGSDRRGARGTYPAVAGTLLRNVFWESTTLKAADLDRDGTVTPTEAWAASHATAVRWPVK